MPFFNTDSFTAPSLSMETFREWANSVASSYFKAGTPPTDSLCKLAQTEELTPHQIEVLAGEVNKAIHTVKHASAQDKYLAAGFPLADAKEALSRLQGGSLSKVAFEIPQPKVTSDYDYYGAWGVKPEAHNKTAQLRHEINHAAQKTAQLNARLRDRAILSKHAADKAESAFIKEARQVVLEGHSAQERMQKLGFLEKFVSMISYPEARPMLAKLAYVLGREGLLEPSGAKHAVEYLTKTGAAAPDGMHDPKLQPVLARGDTSLEITLRTFRKHTEDHRSCLDRGAVVEDRLSELGQRLRVVR